MKAPHVVCLCSGGVDSAVLLAILLGQGWHCTPLFIDYGQVCAKLEECALLNVCAHFSVESVRKQINVGWNNQASMLMGSGDRSFLLHRNLVLLLTADLLAAELGCEGIAIGLCESLYPDSSRAFLALAQQCLSVSGASDRVLWAPLIELKKEDIGRFAAELGVPIEQTISCHRGVQTPCGTCFGCLDRQTALEAYYEISPSKRTRTIS